MFKLIVLIKRRIKNYIDYLNMFIIIYYVLKKKNSCNSILGIVLYSLLGRGKKIVGFYGECHILVYEKLLVNNKEFKKRYIPIFQKDIEYLVKKFKKYINNPQIWHDIDVFIYNPDIPIRSNAPTLNDIKGWLKKDCELISVTNAIFKGYMPQHTEKVFENDGDFVWGDKNINTIIENSSNIDSDNLLDELKKENYYDKEYVKKYFDKQVHYLELFEKNCTIKIADYIKEHGKKEILYYSITHPEIIVFVEITKRIAEILGISKLIIDKKNMSIIDLHVHGEVVYPSVYSGLGIQMAMYKERIIDPGHNGLKLDFDEYIDTYYKEGKMICKKNIY